MCNCINCPTTTSIVASMWPYYTVFCYIFNVLLSNSFEELVHYVCSIPCKNSPLFHSLQQETCTSKSAGITILTIQDSSIAMVFQEPIQWPNVLDPMKRQADLSPAEGEGENRRQNFQGKRDLEQNEEVTHKKMLLQTEKFVMSTVFLQCCSMFECWKIASSHIKSSTSCTEKSLWRLGGRMCIF